MGAVVLREAQAFLRSTLAGGFSQGLGSGVPPCSLERRLIG